MATYQTAQSGEWFTATTWSPQGVPALGDSVIINHLVYAEQTVIVGSGESNTVMLTKPLVCFKNLYVLGGLQGTGDGGLFFLSDSMDWVFYASEGFSLPPVSQETLESIWGTIPEGYLLAVSGQVPADAYLAPHRHEILTPLLQALRQQPEVFAAHHHINDPLYQGQVILTLYDADGNLLTPSTLTSFVQSLQAQAGAATTLKTQLSWTIGFAVDARMALFLWLKDKIADGVVGVKETNDAFEVLLKRVTNPNDAVRTLAQAQGIIAEAGFLFNLLGITKPIVGRVI